MAIKLRNTRNTQMNMASMADLVFLLLIFFMLTSTLIAPNAIKLLLPASESRTMAKQTVTLYIDENAQVYIEETPVDLNTLHTGLLSKLGTETEGSVVLRSDKSVSIQNVVSIIDVVNNINAQYNTKHKVILATQPQR